MATVAAVVTATVTAAVTTAVALTAALLTGCGDKEPAVVKTYSASDSSVVRTYYELEDGTWKCGDAIYTIRTELSGTYGTTGAPVACIVLTNSESTTFEDVADKLLSISSTPTPETPVVVEIHS